jgi:chromate transport protein ChrA
MLGHAFFERICARPTVRGFLDGVTAAAIGIMAAATIGLARSGLGSPVPAGFAVVAFLLLWSWKGRAAVPTVVLAAGLAGLAVGAA